jgi:hypothetical protein
MSTEPENVKMNELSSYLSRKIVAGMYYTLHFYVRLGFFPEIKKISDGKSRKTVHTSRNAIACLLAIWALVIAVLNNLLGMTRLAPLPSVPASPFLYPARATHKIPAGHCGVLVAAIAVKLKIGTTVYDQGDSAKRFLDHGVVECHQLFQPLALVRF